ncbi:unnamed protein product [Angiostrongylus costaricensis]|uniref:G_PROTEIN_RECEP_F1_2 domain-containing protein n=1 Tax=Angiostrongylus costaricensis TaxID=334426 RepID=A0A0R3PFK0_ANGCS|nr:unnamed protein product [Angiostrongylus costaricensis]
MVKQLSAHQTRRAIGEHQYCFSFLKFHFHSLTLFQAIPCALLLWFTIALVLKLRKTDEKRNYLYSKSFRKHIKKTTVPDRTTYMLIVVLVVFLVTELPQGFLALLNGWHHFFYSLIHFFVDLVKTSLNRENGNKCIAKALTKITV